MVEFCKYVTPDYRVDPFHEKVGQIYDDIIAGKRRRIMISAPPQHGKSRETTSLMAKWIGDRPHDPVIMTSYGADLATSHNRNARDIVESEAYNKLYPHIKTKRDKRGETRWDIEGHRGYSLAAGVRGPITGRGCMLGIIDDPLENWQQALSKVYREAIWDWYKSTFRTRVWENGVILIVMCLTGDSQISMADGSRKSLKGIRPGDKVLSWEDGKVVSRKVLRWKNCGEDDVFEIRTRNGKVKANSRHPFLVKKSGGFEWVKVKDLKKGDQIVTNQKIPSNGKRRLTDSQAWLLGYMFGDGWVTIRDGLQKGYKGRTYPKRGFVTCFAKSDDDAENKKVLRLFKTLFGVDLQESKYGYYQTGVASVGRWFLDRGLVGKAKTKRLPNYLYGQPVSVRLSFITGYNAADGHIIPESSNDSGRWVHCCSNKELAEDIRHLARGVSFRVSNLNEYHYEAQPPNSKKPVQAVNIRYSFRPERVDADFITSPVVSVTSVGREVVYDLQIEGTEAFIANGMVVHNTRWHEEDLIGKLLAEGGEEWEWFRFTAIAETPEERREASIVLRLPEEEKDLLDRESGEALCPQRYSASELTKIKRDVGPLVWSGMYRGLPRTQEGNIFKKLWFRYFDETDIYYRLFRDESLEPDLVLRHKCWTFVTVDLAAGLRESNDPSVIAVWTVTPKWDLLLMEIYRAQISAADFLPILQNMMRKWKCKFAGIESVGMQIKEIQYARRRGLTVKECKADKDKLLRSITAQVRYQGSQIFHPIYSPQVSSWLSVFEDEILNFQLGCAYDDQVDVTSYAAIEVAQLQIRGTVRMPSTKPLTPTPMDLFRPI